MSKKKYLICVDLDETLLTTDKTISDYTIKSIKELYRNGHYFIFSSGRPYHGMVNFAHMLGIDELPIASLNGASICWTNYKEDKITKSITFTIPNSLVVSLFKESAKYVKAALAYSLKHVYLFHEEYLPWWTIHINDYVSVHKGRLDELIHEDILTMTFQIHAKDINKFEKLAAKKKYKSLFIFNWGQYNDIYSIEIALKLATKGHALKYLQSLYKIDDKCTISFGDGPNDITMLEDAYEGVTMCNSREYILKQGKNFTFLSNNEDGVIDYLRKVHPELWEK